MTPTETTLPSLTNCDREPIHVPGAILPHGALLVVDTNDFTVLQAAGDVEGLLGLSLERLLGGSLKTIFRPDQLDLLRTLDAGSELIKPRHLLDPLMRTAPDRPLDASIHRSEGSLVLEFEAADLTDRFAADPLAGVQEMVDGIDASATLQSMCQMAAERVRQVARYDRVLVYRFLDDGSGWVIAESCEPHLEPFLDLHYPAADIPQQARALYVKNWLRLITQVNYEPALLTPPAHPVTGRPLDMSQAILRDVSPVHREYLRNMGIDASMSISIIRGGELWGLIACHHYSPRLLPRHLRAVCELFGSMFSLHLEARERGDQFEERLTSRMVLQNLMLNLASADDYAIGLTQESPNLLDYIPCGHSAADAERQGGVAVAVKGQLTFLGVTPTQSQIVALVAWLDTQVAKDSGAFSTDRLAEHWAPAAEYADVSSGILAISVSDEPSDFIIWFRPELVSTTRWAGRQGKTVTSGVDGDRLSPRKSFEAWKETVRGRCQPWTPADLDAAFDLRISLLHVVLRRINTAALERKRAAERDQLLMAELDHRVKNTIANIQALVVQTSRSAESLTGFVEGLDGRIRSMAKAHSLLSQSRWEGVSITHLLNEELEAYVGKPTGVELRGADTLLTPKSALSLSLAIHELATNAAKFGSLTKPDGRVSVTWQALEDGTVELTWAESGGPLVAKPTHRGFGSTLIERALAMETGGRANLHYLRTGVVCEIFLPASAVLHALAAAVPEVEAVALKPAVQTVPDALRILLVEDSFLIVMTVEEFFDDLGWTIVGPASRRADALILARSETFDAALLDVNLDGDMSWEVAEVLKERKIPFLFSTGYDVTSILPPGLVGSTIIGKPFRLSDLEIRLREVVADARRLLPA